MRFIPYTNRIVVKDGRDCVVGYVVPTLTGGYVFNPKIVLSKDERLEISQYVENLNVQTKASKGR